MIGNFVYYEYKLVQVAGMDERFMAIKGIGGMIIIGGWFNEHNSISKRNSRKVRTE